jgi:hypothetical protein
VKTYIIRTQLVVTDTRDIEIQVAINKNIRRPYTTWKEIYWKTERKMVRLVLFPDDPILGRTEEENLLTYLLHGAEYYLKS